MRKINSIIATIILVLLVDHIIFATLHLAGYPVHVFGPLAYLMLALVIIHGVLSMILTVNAEKTGMKTKARYNKENAEFWARRTSGVAILAFAIFHAHAMMKLPDGRPRISTLGPIARICNIGLAISVCVHIVINIKPLMISLGIRKHNLLSKILYVFFVLLTVIACYFLALVLIRGGANHD